jgi:predicted SprT family Zn-dependent metalloprotease
MLTIEQAFSPTIANCAESWFAVWDLANLATDVRVRFSKRMIRAVGRCYPARRLVTLAAAVPEMENDQILNVLCHEFAHIAAYMRFGRAIRPHGIEWQTLMRAAGFRPSVRFSDPAGLALMQARAAPRTQYLHICPLCGAQRITARRMLRWRCGACYEIGREGKLQIIRLPA